MPPQVSLACVRSPFHPGIARRHLDDCASSECRGCLPRQADFGRLCTPCHYQLVRALYALPPARTLLAGHLRPGTYARRSDMITRTQGDPPVPLNLAILDLLTEFDEIPLSWARAHASEHRLAVPDDGPAHLRRHLATVESWPWIADAWDELTGLVSRAHILVPWRPDVTRLGAPCPECHCQALVLVGGDDWITCRECGATIPEDRYDLWSRVLLQERAEEEKKKKNVA